MVRVGIAAGRGVAGLVFRASLGSAFTESPGGGANGKVEGAGLFVFTTGSSSVRPDFLGDVPDAVVGGVNAITFELGAGFSVLLAHTLLYAGYYREVALYYFLK